MDATETGAYIMLIVAHYQAGEAGLKNDDVLLARIAKVSNRVWSKIKDRLSSKFYITNEYWQHQRVVEELLKIAMIRAENSAKALKRHNSPHAAAQPLQCQPIANSQEPLSNPLNPPKGGADESKHFTLWYGAYPHKVGKVAAEKAFSKAIKKTSLAVLMVAVESYIRDKPPDRAWCNPATWLNQERWLDQPKEVNGKQPNKTDRARTALIRSSQALGFAGEPGESTTDGQSNLSVFSGPETVRQGTGSAGEHKRDVPVCTRRLSDGEDFISDVVLPEVQQRDANTGGYSDDN